MGAGSAYVVLAILLSGALTYAFHAFATRALGPEGYGLLALLWSATFLMVQVLWVSGTQTLGRYVSERGARGEDWRPVVSSTLRWQLGLLAAFVLASLLASPLLTGAVFQGNWWLTGAFVLAVAFYAPEYFRRGLFNGHRQFARLGAQIVLESVGRLALGVALVVVGLGVWGPVAAVVLAPLIGVLAVGNRPPEPGGAAGPEFEAGEATRFAAPILVCMAIGQGFASGGVILVSLLGGSPAEVAVFGAALILTRIPQYVLSPAVESLLPHLSGTLASRGRRAFDRLVLRLGALLVLVGVAMVVLSGLFGGWAVRVFTGDAAFSPETVVLVLLAALAALYIFCDFLNQVLFARGLTRLSMLAWLLGVPVAVALLVLPPGEDLLVGVSAALVSGIACVAAAQTGFCLFTKK
ncbi:lipopolysaccharide biosynthesis protein [Rubrobacter indicoceani]|uniref:lipopolysaccharide biosynthesis protein n=1 Tax=Rubrobacter indicoceani TaxID=2051957 RepID=UPI000E5A8FC8|nr:lipopolysaccharide biosynthesis protein [Rubrobacter indicoceani]